MGVRTCLFLTDVRHKGEYFISLFDEPCEDARGV